jgi:hypothetical protein
MNTHYWKGKQLKEYIAHAGLLESTDEVVLTDQHGTLIMRKTGNEYRPLPGLAARAKNLGSTLLNAATSDKKLLAASNVVEHREKICNTCPYLKDGICRSCGCMTLAKVKLTVSRCPEGKWQ